MGALVRTRGAGRDAALQLGPILLLRGIDNGDCPRVRKPEAPQSIFAENFPLRAFWEREVFDGTNVIGIVVGPVGREEDLVNNVVICKKRG